MNVLLLCDYPRDIASTVADHIDAITHHSTSCVTVLRMLGNFSLALELNRFDVVIIHYTLVMSMDAYISPASRARIQAFNGLKAAFIQDEYRFVDQTISAMRELGIDLLFTCVPDSQIEKVYSQEKLPGVTKVNVLTGYVPSPLAKVCVPAYAARKFDVGYRSRDVPEWLGAMGLEKTNIGCRFVEDGPKFGLVVNSSTLESDRIYGADWIKFIQSCKAVLGVESGASVFDFSGEIQKNVEAHKSRDPDATFEELQNLYFKDKEGLINLSQISPRCFEAAALGTLMVLYEGHYSGVLTPWRHYVPLKKDHSNMAEVTQVIRDEKRAMEIIEFARLEVAQNEQWSDLAFGRKVNLELESCFKTHHAALLAPYSSRALNKILRDARGSHNCTQLIRRVVGGTLLALWFASFCHNCTQLIRRVVGELSKVANSVEKLLVPVLYPKRVRSCLKWMFTRVSGLFVWAQSPRRQLASLFRWVNWLVQNVVPIRYQCQVRACLKGLYFRVLRLFGKPVL
jgi:hypothetical protein